MNNYEHLKELSPEELAEFLSAVTEEKSDDFKKWLDEEYIKEEPKSTKINFDQAKVILAEELLDLLAPLDQDKELSENDDYTRFINAHKMAIRSLGAWNEFVKWISTHFPWNEDEKLLQQIKKSMEYIVEDST